MGYAFESKEALGIAALQDYYQQASQRLSQDSLVSVSDPSTRVLAFLEQVESTMSEEWAAGCMMGSFALELSETNGPTRIS